MILEQPWWSYVMVSMGFFLVCLALNYAVKKMNEVRMGDRLVRVLEKSSVTQSTHVNGPVISVPSEGEPRTISVKAPQPYSAPAISLVFDKEENKRIGDVYNMVKPLTDWKYGDPSLNADDKSMETNNVLPKSSERTMDESSPTKKIECEVVTAIATSSNKFSEKVIKDKIDSHHQITPKICSNSEIPGIAGTNTNSVSAKEPRRIIIRGSSYIEPKNTVAENNSFSNTCADQMVPTNISTVENTVKNTKVIEDNKSREKIATGCLDSIITKVASLKNIDDNPRIEKNATTTIIAKSSSSHSGSIRNETKITPTEKKESSHSHTNPVGESIPVKTSKSEQIVLKETSFDAQNESHIGEYVPIKNNIIMKSSSNERSHYTVTESVPFENTESGPVLAEASYIDKVDSSDLSSGLENKSIFSCTEYLTFEETAARKRSDRTLGEGSTSNAPTNTVGENIPLEYIGAGQIFPTKISITEIAVKDPKVIGDKKSNEEIDTSCLDGVKSKIATFKNMNVRIEKSVTLCNRNVIKISSVEKTESKEVLPDTQLKRNVREHASIRARVKNECRINELKKTTSNEQSSCNNIEYVPIKTSEPGRIVASRTALLTRSDTNVTVLGHAFENATGRIVAEATTSHTQSPIRTSEFGFLATEETSNRQSNDNVPGTNIATPPNTQSEGEITVSKDDSVKKTESGVSFKETANIQTDTNVLDSDTVETCESRRTAVEEKSLKKLFWANNATEYVSIKTSASGSIDAREISSHTLSGSELLNCIQMNESGSIANEIYNRQCNSSAVKSESFRELVSANDATEFVIFQKSGSGSILTGETNVSRRQNDDKVPDTNVVHIAGSGPSPGVQLAKKKQ